MNKNDYKAPWIRVIDLTTEGLVASSPEGTLNVKSDEQTRDNFDWSQKKEDGGWGESDIWK